ncbi:SOS response associated peptidase (SRAP) [Bifidobacterium dolichotidis]|uniref:Abasic site processing protein n=1 Tax=Bifidobacterium dolichotidis TaxID=2306976 RepID=A0A430FQW1_9BIFI|nr:SOS response-associated peptidase family protein [Bifidobacterium dolichotidis]RSX55210.1 SOS response associated peptidase (SRAP) [Bifidobacterium dolichotidis]
MCARYEALTLEHVQAILTQLTGDEPEHDPTEMAQPAQPERPEQTELPMQQDYASATQQELEFDEPQEREAKPQQHIPASHDHDVFPSSITPVLLPTFDTASGLQSLQARASSNAENSEASPASQRKLYLPSHSLQIAQLRWGCDASWMNQPVFNTRIESTDKPFWRSAMEHERCIIACRRFYEFAQTPYSEAEFGDGMATAMHDSAEINIATKPKRARKRQFVFTVPNMPVMLIGAVRKGNTFSMITTAANAAMAPIHPRMPLVLHPLELQQWLSPDYFALADRSKVPFHVEPAN